MILVSIMAESDDDCIDDVDEKGSGSVKRIVEDVVMIFDPVSSLGVL